MKHQALFSLKDTSTKIKVSSAAILFGTIRVKNMHKKNTGLFSAMFTCFSTYFIIFISYVCIDHPRWY